MNIFPQKKNKIKTESESHIQHQVIVFLTKIKNSRLFRNYNCVPFDSRTGKPKRKSSSLNPPGLPDLTFHYRGRTIYFEIKSKDAHRFILKHIDRLRTEIAEGKLESNKHVKRQIKLMDDLIQIGIPCFFISSPEQVDVYMKDVFGGNYLG